MAANTKVPSLFARYAKHIDHIALAVTDLDAAERWYVDSVGFTLLERRETRGEHTAMRSSVVKLGDIVFVLTQGTSPDSQVSRFMEHHGAGVTHIALEVDHLRDVVAELRTAGVVFATDILESQGLLQAFTQRDPLSGLMIELIERRGGSFTDESVQRLFRQLEERNEY